MKKYFSIKEDLLHNWQANGIAIARILLTSLLLFESMNLIGIYNVQIDFTWAGLIATVVAIWLAVELVNYFLEKKTKLAIAAWVFLVATLAIYIDAIVDINGWYGKFFWYDQMAHLVSGLAVAAIIAYIVLRLEQSKIIKLTAITFLIFVLAGAMALGSIYEIEEYLEDFFTGSNRLGDGPDTANDLMLNTIGALIAVGVVMWVRRKSLIIKK